MSTDHPKNEERLSGRAVLGAGSTDRNYAETPARLTAKSLLAEKIWKVENDLSRLKILYNTMPDLAVPQADQALYDIIMRAF
jgi:hypothetical protein